MNQSIMGKTKTTRRKHSAYNMPNQAGVYIIYSPSGRYYIGRSKNMRNRCLAHVYRATADEEENMILNRSIRKYGNRMKYKVLLQTSCETDAVYFEEQYIRMHWRDEKCMNIKVGDKITADYNKDHKSKPVAYVNVYTQQLTWFASATAACAYFKPESNSRTAPVRVGHMIRFDRYEDDSTTQHRVRQIRQTEPTLRRCWYVDALLFERQYYAARYIGCHQSTLSNALSAGQMTYNNKTYRVGNLTRFFCVASLLYAVL